MFILQMKEHGFILGLIFLLFFADVGTLWAQKNPEKDPGWWLSQARFVYEQGDFLGALYIVREARNRFPKHGEFAILEARILYDLGHPEKCVKILGPLSLSYELKPEDLLLLSRAYLDLKDLGNALFYARLVEKKARKPELICEARVIAARAYLKNKLRRKAIRQAREILQGGCSDKIVAQALEILLETGLPPQKIQGYLARNPNLKLYAPKIFKYLGDRLLAEGKLFEAEESYFRYLNLSGKEEEAPPIFLKLAEAAFHQKKLRKARLYYKLLATVWPHRDEAQFAKFRLYHLAYILNKRLGLPTLKQRKALIPIINDLRRKHPDNPITQEAQAFEIELYLEDKRPEKAFETAIDFVQRYPRSRHLSRVYRLLCEADNLYLARLFTEKAYSRILELERNYRKFASQATCGAHFYWVGKVYERFYLYTRRNYYFLRALEWGVPRSYRPELYLALTEAALKEKRFAEARDLLEAFLKEFPFYRKNPAYLYLEGLYHYQTGNLQRAGRIFERLVSSRDLPRALRQKVLESYLSLALATRNIDLALRILEAPDFNATDNDFAFLIQLALENEDYLRARRILNKARRRFPDSVTLKWLAGLYFEKTGREEALAVWRELASENSTEGRLAQGILKSLELVEAARKVIY